MIGTIMAWPNQSRKKSPLSSKFLNSLILTLCFRSVFVAAQFPVQMLFKGYSVDQGLSQASVNCILRDSRGFMWFGTEDGLNRFDGNQFKVFRTMHDDTTSLSSNTILSILEDPTGKIWVGTSDCISYYDRLMERFHSFPLPGRDYYIAAHLEYDSVRNRIWIASGYVGLAFIDLASMTIHEFPHQELASTHIWTIDIIGDKIYAGTIESGLKIIDVEKKQIETILLDNKDASVISAIRAMETAGDKLWIGTEGAGLKLYDTKNKHVSTFDKKINGGISDDKVWSLAWDKKGMLWVGTDGGGLNVFDPRDGKVKEVFRHSEYNLRTISGNTIRSIFIEQDGSIWLGTYNAGINYHRDFGINFSLFKKNIEEPFTLSHNSIMAFAESSDGTLWIATDGGGLNYMRDQKFYQFEFPPHVDKPAVIQCLFYDDQGGLWAGSYQHGLYYIDRNKGVQQFMPDSRNKKGISSNVIWNIIGGPSGEIWLGTDNGFNAYDPVSGEFLNYLNKPRTADSVLFFNDQGAALLLDSDQKLWLGSFGMLMSFDKRTGSVKQYTNVPADSTSIPNSLVLNILEDKNGYLWMGLYGGGLVRFDRQTGKCLVIDEKKGLPNNLIFAVIEDDEGNLWASSNKGLVRFDPVHNKFDLFDSNFGIQGASFNENAAFKTKGGYLLFGGTKGFNAFIPGKVNVDQKELKVIFTDFQLFNESVKPGGSILSQSITETQSIHLDYNQAKMLSFQFSALHFLSPKIIQYQYALEGFQNSWQLAGNDRKITFTNLYPGTYTLKIKAGFPSQLYGEESVMVILVKTPWWMTWYARLVGIFFIIAMAYIFFRARTHNLKKAKERLRQMVLEKNKEIKHQNDALTFQNEELIERNEEIIVQKERITEQNELLIQAKERLIALNQNLENIVSQRTEKLNETIDQLNKTIQELDSFVYSASHDLVAPLKSILGLVNLTRSVNKNQDLEAYLDHMESSVNKLNLVIKSLIQYSKNSQLKVATEPLKLKNLICEVIDSLKYMPGFERIKFDMMVNDEVKANTDPQRLSIILNNIVGNAVKYQDTYKEEPIIKVRYWKEDPRFWNLEVFDNGIGIDKHYIDRIFDMFYRATDNAHGSGLGLFIAKETIIRLNGDVTVESEKGKWTRFTMTFQD